MTIEHCPHCGVKLPLVRDAFCGFCDEPLDEPPEKPRTREEQEAFRAQVEREARENMGILNRFFRWFGRS